MIANNYCKNMICQIMTILHCFGRSVVFPPAVLPFAKICFCDLIYVCIDVVQVMRTMH